MKAYLILEDGTVFEGTSIGADKEVISEIVFNTSMAGYLEVLTDPSYAGQAVCMTYPLIGNYGVCRDDCESRRPWPDGFIVRELSGMPSNFRSDCSIQEYLKEYDVPGIAGIDTRALTKILREKGTMNGMITTNENYDLEEILPKLSAYTTGKVVEKVSCTEKYEVKGAEDLSENGPVSGSAVFYKEAYAAGVKEKRPSLVKELNGKGKRVALMDFGAKANIARSLAMRGCDVTVYPAWTKAEEIRQAAAEAEAAQETLARIIAGRCGMTAEDVALKFFSGGDHWIGAEEALSMGLIDSIYDIDGDVPESGASPDDIYTMTNRLNSQPHKHNDMALIDELRKIPSLSNAAGEQDMLQHITRLENEAAKVPALTARVETLEKERNETLKAAHEALVDMGVSDGRITAAQKEMFMGLLASDEKNTRALLDSMPKKQARVTDFIDGHKGNGNDLASMTWDQIDRAGRLAELKDKYPDLYMQKFNETFKKQ